MIVETDGPEEIEIDYEPIHDLSIRILTSLVEQKVGASSLAVALTLARLRNPDPVRLPPEREIEFVQDLLLWTDTWLAVPEGAIVH